MKEIVLAAFRIEKRNSVAYQRYRTINGFLEGIRRVIETCDPDYISIRIIKQWEREVKPDD